MVDQTQEVIIMCYIMNRKYKWHQALRNRQAINLWNSIRIGWKTEQLTKQMNCNNC